MGGSWYYLFTELKIKETLEEGKQNDLNVSMMGPVQPMQIEDSGLYRNKILRQEMTNIQKAYYLLVSINIYEQLYRVLQESCPSCNVIWDLKWKYHWMSNMNQGILRSGVEQQSAQFPREFVIYVIM